MAIIPEGTGATFGEFLAINAANRYPLTHDGDKALRPNFDEAVIRAAVVDNNADARRDAEAIAQYIITLPYSMLTHVHQEDVKGRLSTSQQSDDELSEQGIKREIATASLKQANTNYFDALHLEQRAALARLSIF